MKYLHVDHSLRLFDERYQSCLHQTACIEYTLYLVSIYIHINCNVANDKMKVLKDVECINNYVSRHIHTHIRENICNMDK